MGNMRNMKQHNDGPNHNMSPANPHFLFLDKNLQVALVMYINKHSALYSDCWWCWIRHDLLLLAMHAYVCVALKLACACIFLIKPLGQCTCIELCTAKLKHWKKEWKVRQRQRRGYALFHDVVPTKLFVEVELERSTRRDWSYLNGL